MRAQKYNITASTLIQIYKDLEGVFGEGNVVIIGGRAVNILCSKDHRYTNDLDIVAATNLSFEEMNRKLWENGFVADDYGKVLHGHSTKYIHKLSGVKIDLYIFYGGEKRAEWPISGIPKEDIMNHAKEVEIKNTYVKVVDPVLLVLMKYNANREKDYIDIAKIITHVYRGDFGAFEKKAKPIIESYLKESGEENKSDINNRINYTIELLKKIYEEYKDKSDIELAMRYN
jgi:predicted nucleotidyltransferase